DLVQPGVATGAGLRGEAEAHELYARAADQSLASAARSGHDPRLDRGGMVEHHDADVVGAAPSGIRERPFDLDRLAAGLAVVNGIDDDHDGLGLDAVTRREHH